MFPMQMYYNDPETQKNAVVTVYSIQHVVIGETVEVLVTAWDSKNNNWITSPIWYFEPYEIKTLLE